jgi:membrane protein YfhO
VTRAARAIGPTVLVAVVALLLFPVVLGRSFWLRDTLLFTYPLKAYLRARMAHGELALWNPLLGLGRPFAGVVQPGVFYPFDVVLLLPYPRGVDLFFALHAFIAAFGMRAWLRNRGSDEVAAVFGGALFALSGYFVSVLVGAGTFAVGAAWMPWALSRPTSPVRVGVALALMVLGGDPQAAWWTAILLVVVAATHAERKRALVAVGAGFALAAALAAVQLGPALEVARVGRPGGVPIDEASHFSFAPLRLFELVWPGAFGPRYGADWLVHPLYDEGTGRAYEPFAAGIYVGLLTPLLALAAVARRTRRRGDLALAIVAAIAVVLALGRHAPLFAVWYRVVPGARLFRYPEKYLLPATLIVAALAATGLPRVVAAPRRALAVGGGFVALLLVGWLWAAHGGGAFFAHALGRLEHGSVDDLGATLATCARNAVLVAVAALLPLVLAARGRLSARASTIALAAVVVGELLAQSSSLVEWVPSALYQETPPPVAAARALAPAGLLRLYRPLYLHFDTPLAPAAALRATLRPDCGVDDGIATLDAYDNFAMPAEQALWRALERQPLRLVAVAATRFVLVPPRLFAPRGGLVERARWPALGAVLGEATESAPRVYLAIDARVADDDDAAKQLAASDFVPGRSAVLAAGSEAHADGSCTLEEDRIERLVVRCHASAPSYAVVADAWFPGWYAAVDGTAAPIVRANLAMRAVPVPAGDHVVELRYRPAGLVAGAVISLFALVFCVAITVRAYRRPSPAG